MAGRGHAHWRRENVHFVLFCMDLRSAAGLNLATVEMDWRFDRYNLIVLLARRNSGPATGVRVGVPRNGAQAGRWCLIFREGRGQRW